MPRAISPSVVYSARRERRKKAWRRASIAVSLSSNTSSLSNPTTFLLHYPHRTLPIALRSSFPKFSSRHSQLQRGSNPNEASLVMCNWMAFLLLLLAAILLLTSQMLTSPSTSAARNKMLSVHISLETNLLLQFR